MKIYISGKITGIEEMAPILFEEVEQLYVDMGHGVVNPMKLNHNHDKSWKAYMREDLIALKTCTHIHLLDNWQDSRGARIEQWYAQRYAIKYANDFKYKTYNANGTPKQTMDYQVIDGTIKNIHVHDHNA